MCGLHKLINITEKTNIASRGSTGQHHTPLAFNGRIWCRKWAGQRSPSPTLSGKQLLSFFIRTQKACLLQTVPTSPTIKEVRVRNEGHSSIMGRWTGQAETRAGSSTRASCPGHSGNPEPSFITQQGKKIKWREVRFWSRRAS